MSKHVHALYFSPTDGTKKIIKAIADGFGDSYTEHDLTLPMGRESTPSFGADDIVIVGVPVYAGRVPKLMTAFFAELKGSQTPVILATVYGNRNYDDALIELRDIFVANGFVPVSAGAFIGEHSNTSKVGTGRPDAADLDAAKAFGVSSAEKLAGAVALPALTVKGNVPYKESMPAPPITPDTSDACIHCGICTRHCPTAAISPEDDITIDPTKCIRCCSCIKRCPVHAKSINHEVFNKITQMLLDNFSAVRHEPELFF